MRSDVLKELADEINAGRTAVLVTVLSTSGSTPRKAGSQMLVRRDGSIFGTIGGGLAEAEAMAAAKTLFKEGRSVLRRITMTSEVTAGEGMACGGDMEIFLQLADCKTLS